MRGLLAARAVIPFRSQLWQDKESTKLVEFLHLIPPSSKDS